MRTKTLVMSSWFLLENIASERVLEKCGFETFFSGEGAYHDGVYEISKSVWKV